MRPYVLYAAAEAVFAEKLSLKRGRLSYTADGSRLLCEKLIGGARGGMMVVSVTNASPHIAAPIYDECRRHGYDSVFLDLDAPPTRAYATLVSDISDALVRRIGTVYVPEPFAAFCHSATPVASTAISGGSLPEYMESLARGHNRNIAFAIPRICADFPMPADNPAGSPLTKAELTRLINRFDAQVYYSPQMLVNYFTYSSAPNTCRFVLFDDARSISEKLRLISSFGAKDAFLIYREIADIAAEITL